MKRTLPLMYVGTFTTLTSAAIHIFIKIAIQVAGDHDLVACNHLTRFCPQQLPDTVFLSIVATCMWHVLYYMVAIHHLVGYSASTTPVRHLSRFGDMRTLHFYYSAPSIHGAT